MTQLSFRGTRLLIAMLALPMVLALTTQGMAEEEGARGRNPRLFVLPAPDNVKIDGDLSDWDTSGGIFSYPSKALSDERAITSYAMYDEEALYIAGRVRDTTPMMNRHDPKVNANKAWDADAFQFRMYLQPRYPGAHSKFDKKRYGGYEIAHLLLWYYTDRKQANLQALYSMGYDQPKRDWPDGVVPHDQFDGAYRKWDKSEEGRAGYTFEYRIPWDTLSTEYQPKAGDVTAANIQVQYGRADGLKSLGGEGWVVDLLRKPGFPFQQSTCWGKAIFATQGDLPASVGEGDDDTEQMQRPTPLSLEYELPRDGHVSIGLYDQNNLLRRQIVAEAKREKGTVTEQWDGMDHRGEPLEPGSYTWRGIVSDKIETEFILSVHNAGNPPHKTDDNTGGWGGDHGQPMTAAAAGERMLLSWSAAESGWGVIRTDLTGDKHWGSKASATYLAVSDDAERYFTAGGHGFASHAGVRVRDVADSRPLNFSSGKPIAEMPTLPDNAEDDAEQNEQKNLNKVTGIATRAGKLYISYGHRNLIAVNNAESGKLENTWSIESPGRLAIASDGAVLAISGGRIVKITDGNTSAFASDHVDEPDGIAVDDAGHVYVTNQGDLHNVSVFDASGEFVKAIGKEGGRPRIGRFEADGMLAPGGCAIDAQGRLWVAETLDRPKRVSVWDTETGENVDQFFGGSSYFGWAWMDPEKPGEVYNHGCLWKIDVDERTKRIHSTIWRTVGENAVPGMNPGGHTGAFRVFTADNGRQFGFGGSGRARSRVMFMRDGDIYKPIAGMISRNPDRYPALEDKIKKWNEQWDEQNVASYKRPNRLFWQDANDDQAVQPGEVTAPPTGRGNRGYFNWIGQDLTVWNRNGTMLKPVRFAGDRPIYDFAKQADGFKPAAGGIGQMWFDDRESDGIYNLSRGGPHALSKWTRDGELLWSTGQRPRWRDALGFPVMQPGDIWGMTMALTLAGDFTGAATYFGGYHVFTRDGLYVAMLMRSGKGGGGLGPDITASETVTGQLVKPTGMNRHFLLAGDQDGRVTEVHGLDTVQKLAGGSINLTPEDVQKAIAAKREYESAQQSAGALFVLRDKASFEQDHGMVRKSVDDQRAWRAQLAHDSENLYVHYRVKSPSPLVNSADDPQLLFKGGNLMDVQLATNPDADPQREEPAEGDVRLLISQRASGEPVAVLFQPQVKGHDGERITLSSPTGNESFDAIQTIEQVKLQHEKTDTGFTATVTVPLDAIGWQPESGQVIKADLGYIFGNKTGNRVSARSYWQNNSFTANVIDDIPHESRLQPHEWGTAIIE